MGINFTICQFHHEVHKGHEVRRLKDLFIKLCAFVLFVVKKGAKINREAKC